MAKAKKKLILINIRVDEEFYYEVKEKTAHYGMSEFIRDAIKEKLERASQES